MNRAYRDVVEAFDWRTTHARTALRMTARRNDGTVTASAGSTAVTFSEGDWTATSGAELRRLNAGSEHMPLTAVAAGGCTLAVALGTALSGAAYELYQDRYELPSAVGKVLSVHIDRYAPLTMHGGLGIDMVNALDKGPGIPTDAYLIGDETGGTIAIMVNPYPIQPHLLHVLYESRLTELSSDGDTPDMLPEEAHELVLKKAEVYVAAFNGDPSILRHARDEYLGEGARFQQRSRIPMAFQLDPSMFRQGERY